MSEKASLVEVVVDQVSRWIMLGDLAQIVLDYYLSMSLLYSEFHDACISGNMRKLKHLIKTVGLTPIVLPESISGLYPVKGVALRYRFTPDLRLNFATVLNYGHYDMFDFLNNLCPHVVGESNFRKGFLPPAEFTKRLWKSMGCDLVEKVSNDNGSSDDDDDDNNDNNDDGDDVSQTSSESVYDVASGFVRKCINDDDTSVLSIPAAVERIAERKFLIEELFDNDSIGHLWHVLKDTNSVNRHLPELQKTVKHGYSSPSQQVMQAMICESLGEEFIEFRRCTFVREVRSGRRYPCMNEAVLGVSHSFCERCFKLSSDLSVLHLQNTLQDRYYLQHKAPPSQQEQNRHSRKTRMPLPGQRIGRVLERVHNMAKQRPANANDTGSAAAAAAATTLDSINSDTVNPCNYAESLRGRYSSRFRSRSRSKPRSSSRSNSPIDADNK